METISSLAQIDAKLRQIGEAWGQSQDAVRDVFGSFTMDFKEFYRDLPRDPFSPEYHDFQMRMYDTLAGKKYEVTNEVTPVDVGPSVTCPFPYVSRSNEIAGAHLSSLGFIIRGMKLAPGSRVIEFGAGWANTTITLALLGHQVTVVEIEPRFCDLIRQRARLNNVEIEVINSDFFSCESMTEQFDAALFYECFHHCSDHVRLLRGLQKLVKPAGALYLGSEPITPQFPVPWGLRLDGESLWAIRQNGWMELGYREDYFREALRRTGWYVASLQRSVDCDFSNLWTLKRTVDGRIELRAQDATLFTSGTKRPGGPITLDAATGHVLWGPYLDLGAGSWEVQLGLVPGSPRRGLVLADVCGKGGETVFAQTELDLGHSGDVITVPFSLAQPTSRLEARLKALTPATLSISKVTFVPREVRAAWEAPAAPAPVPQRTWRGLTKRALLKLARLVDRPG